MGSAELASLTLEAFEEGYDPETEITMFDMRRGKVEKDFITFISPEASKAVIAYLEWRNRSPNPSDKRDVVEYEKRKTTPESYLFVAKKINRDYLETKNEDMRKLTPGTIKDVYKRLNIHTGMSSAKGTYNKVRSHNMRKHFVTTLRNEGCDGDLVKYFVGHTLGGSEDTYYEGNPDKLKDIYAKFVPYLTIAESIDVSETEAFMKVASENKVLADIHKEDTLKLREIEGLKAEMEEMKAFNNAIQAIMNNPEMRGKFNKLL
jgi:integrase